MKKLLFGFIAMVMVSVGAAAGNVEKTSLLINPVEKKADVDRVKVSIHIVWGRVSKNCTGFGICDFYIDIDLDLDISNISFRAGADANGKLLLDITENGMQSIRKQFNSDTIIIEENFRLSDDVCKALELKPGYTISAGRYRVSKTTTGEYAVVL